MGNTKVMRSGDVRYDRDNKEVKLVRAFVSEVPEKNLWAVMYSDKKMGVVDFGQATNYGKRFFTKKPKKSKPKYQYDIQTFLQRRLYLLDLFLLQIEV